jgi:hypothetical protein
MTTEIQLARQIEKALADDPRTHELGVQVNVSRGLVILHGEVASAERRRAVLDVVWDEVPEADVDDRLFISADTVDGPSTTEVIHSDVRRSENGSTSGDRNTGSGNVTGLA